MINHPTLPPPSYSPYAYFPPTNYLTKPMPLMGTTNSGVLPPSTFLFPPELATHPFFRNQTFPSQPPSITSLPRTQYQNGNKTKSNNEQLSTSNDSSKNLLPTETTPIRSKLR
jgi:hypothetical protein